MYNHLTRRQKNGSGSFKMLSTNYVFTNHIEYVRDEFNKFPDFF